LGGIDSQRRITTVTELEDWLRSLTQARDNPSTESGSKKPVVGANLADPIDKLLLQPDKPPSRSGNIDYFTDPPTIDIGSNMIHRKIWVKRPGASATLVLINEDDLVDDVRDMILKKYANSLGRNFDSPDITLRITARDHSRRQSNGERTLGPEEPITRTLDAYFPGGQTVEGPHH
jgi:osomolarity two-component system response regulator SSK1